MKRKGKLHESKMDLINLVSLHSSWNLILDRSIMEMVMSSALELQVIALSKNLEKILDALLECLQRVPAEITLITLDDQAGLVIELRNIKDLLKGVLKQGNKVLTAAEQHLCQTIANKGDDDVTYHHSKATVTASARGFFSIVEPDLFYDWCGTAKIFVRYVSSETEKTELCEGLLGEGKKLPPGIKEHVIASVTVRRKNHE